jgi:hypothetical protein
MSDTTAEATATDATASTDATTDTDATATQAKPTETVEFWKAKAREQEKRAKDNADAAKRLGEIEESQKTEQQKLTDRLAAAETRAAAAERSALTSRVASEKGVPASALQGDDEAALIKAADELIAWRDSGQSDKSRTRLRVPREGITPGDPKEDEERKAARQLFSPGGTA